MAISLYAANEGFLDDVEPEKIVTFEKALHDHIKSKDVALLDSINESGDYNEEIAAKLYAALTEFKNNGVW